MTGIGRAIKHMRAGMKVARAAWQPGTFVVYMEPLRLPPFNNINTVRKVNDRTAKFIGKDTPLDSLGYFAMFTPDGKWQPGWLPNAQDLLTEDWSTIS